MVELSSFFGFVFCLGLSLSGEGIEVREREVLVNKFLDPLNHESFHCVCILEDRLRRIPDFREK